jgi:N-acylneuraminate cytidylyltransferase
MPELHNSGCVAVIPARGGSKGLPGKNLKLLGGLPLVARSILAAQSSSLVRGVAVSTDADDIAVVAQQYGATVIPRPTELSGDTASSEDALLHALEHLRGQGANPEIVVFLQCTSPFTTGEAIDRVVAALQNDAGASAAFSAAADHGFLWGLDEQGHGFGVNHDHRLPRKRRQDLPRQLRETGAVYAVRVAAFVRERSRFCGLVRPVEVDLPALEIDGAEDLLLAEALLTR